VLAAAKTSQGLTRLLPSQPPSEIMKRRTPVSPLAAVVVPGDVVLADEERVDLVRDGPHPLLHLLLGPGQEEPLRLDEPPWRWSRRGGGRMNDRSSGHKTRENVRRPRDGQQRETATGADVKKQKTKAWKSWSSLHGFHFPEKRDAKGGSSACLQFVGILEQSASSKSVSRQVSQTEIEEHAHFTSNQRTAHEKRFRARPDEAPSLAN